ncbi:MAG: flagellar basal body-associated FliL family protein [Rhodobacteraceae bacterium]|nr:flagellar basal body-associated FliL family protein [Paracoccaceae bacterium]
MKKLLPILLALLGLGAGAGGGYLLRPGAEEKTAEACAPAESAIADHDAPSDAEAELLAEYVKLNNQFVVPIVAGGEVTSLVILSISIEVDAGASEKVFAQEPKLRDAFLQVLFDHANAGGFEGVFTQSSNLDALRVALLEVARKILGEVARDVLITDIVRQDS